MTLRTSGRLLLQRLAQLARALLLSLEKSHILDRDDCLVGKRLGESNLFVSERLHNGTLEEQNSYGCAFALQRDAE